MTTLKDPCSCCGTRESDFELTPLAVQLVPDYADLLGARFAGFCWQSCLNSVVFASRIRARRAALAEPVKFYGVQPAVLPETLPAVTRTTCGLVAERELVLHMSKWHRPGYTQAGRESAFAWVDQIDWSTVPIQEAKADRTLKDTARAIYDEAMRAPGVSVCLFCKSRPMANHDCCAYCRQRVMESGVNYHNESANVAARARMAAADRRERPRSTAESRELAKPHPWEEFE
jgi:hypothetical protein